MKTLESIYHDKISNENRQIIFEASSMDNARFAELVKMVLSTKKVSKTLYDDIMIVRKKDSSLADEIVKQNTYVKNSIDFINVLGDMITEFNSIIKSIRL